jgi:hypothetical protein
MKQGWRHKGEDICYYSNGDKRIIHDKKSKKDDKKRYKNKYSLSFTYTFIEPDIIYFSHCFPYCYTDLQNYLSQLESNERIASIMNRKLLATSIAGNRIDMLIITESTTDVSSYLLKPAIVISSRVHPGESNSSYIMHGLIDFLTSDTSEALLLRNIYLSIYLSI